MAIFPHKLKMYFDFHLLKKFWKLDLVASLSVTLVAIPLAIGTALAGGLPPITGIISVIIAGLITTFFRGSHLTINGPGNGLIVLLPLAMADMHQYQNPFSVLLAIFVMTGIAMLLMGLFKLGKFGDIIPSTVVYGMMAVIGIIIISLQLHPLIGHSFATTKNYEFLIDFILKLPSAYPVATSISVISMVILTLHKTIENKLIHFFPAPMWVLFIVLPLVYIVYPRFGFLQQLEPKDFVSFPTDIKVDFFLPDFTHLGTLQFWKHVFSFTFVICVKSIISIKGVEKLDRKKRVVDVNDDLIGMGIGTIISAFFGGLPVCTILACSSVNVNNNGQSRWGNVFQSVFTFIVVVFFADYLNLLPNTILAAILFFAGYKLVTPRLFKTTWLKGKEQLIILIFTILSSYFFGIKLGVILGSIFTLCTQVYIYEFSLITFFKQWRKTKFKISEKADSYRFLANGVLNFTHILRLKKAIEPHLKDEHVHIQLDNTKLIDLTIMEYLHNLIESQALNGKDLRITGLGFHKSMSSHPHALHYVCDERVEQKVMESLPSRVREIKLYADQNKWDYDTNVKWVHLQLDKFYYFLNKNIEYTKNVLYGNYVEIKIPWELSDVYYGEGISIVEDAYNITTQLVYLPKKITPFILDKEELFDRLSDLITHHEVDFDNHPEFSSKYVLKSANRGKIHEIFTEEVFEYLLNNKTYHVECLGDKMLVFRNRHYMDVTEVKEMVDFTKGLVQLICK